MVVCILWLFLQREDYTLRAVVLSINNGRNSFDAHLAKSVQNKALTTIKELQTSRHCYLILEIGKVKLAMDKLQSSG